MKVVLWELSNVFRAWTLLGTKTQDISASVASILTIFIPSISHEASLWKRNAKSVDSSETQWCKGLNLTPLKLIYCLDFKYNNYIFGLYSLSFF